MYQFRSLNVSSFVKSEIESAHVVLFVKSYCPYCRRAVSILNSYIGSKLSQNDVRVCDIEKRPDCRYIQDYLESITGARTVRAAEVLMRFRHRYREFSLRRNALADVLS